MDFYQLSKYCILCEIQYGPNHSDSNISKLKLKHNNVFLLIRNFVKLQQSIAPKIPNCLPGTKPLISQLQTIYQVHCYSAAQTIRISRVSGQPVRQLVRNNRRNSGYEAIKKADSRMPWRGDKQTMSKKNHWVTLMATDMNKKYFGIGIFFLLPLCDNFAEARNEVCRRFEYWKGTQVFCRT